MDVIWNRKDNFVTKHEVGKVYESDGKAYLLVHVSYVGMYGYTLMNLETGQGGIIYNSLVDMDIDPERQKDILVNAIVTID